MSRPRSAASVAVLSVVLAVLLGLLPLPSVVAGFKPYWLGVVLIYWVLERPDRAGLGVAFLLGLIADLVYGTLLGEQALRLCIIAFLVLRFRPRLRFFPLSQQALAVAALLLNDRVVVVIIRVASGEGLPSADFWLSPLTGLLLWPWIFLLLDRWRLRLRYRES